MRVRVRERMPRSTDSRSFTTRLIHLRPPTSPRWCARSRRQIPTSSWSAPIRSNSVGMLKAVNEVGFKPKMIGGAMVGLQATAFKNQLGPLLNGVVNYETWVPDEKLTFAGTEDFFKKYQARAAAEGVDPLGYYLGGWGYAYIQVLADAVQATKSLNDDKLAEYLGKTTFKTILGDVKFGKGGEWDKGRMLQVQYHDIKPGAGLETWRGMSYQTVLTPSDYKTGNVIYPYEKAKM